jgi:predicted dehydrogenase
MLQDGCKPDAAIVCTPNNTHAIIAKDLLTAGVHVLVEKPIATTIQDGRDLIKVAQSSGKQLLVGHHRRFNPYIAATKKVLEDGIIGRPIAISGLWALFKPPSYFAAPTEWRAKSDGGGVIMINLIHEVDILQFLFGPVVKVHAERTTSIRGHEVEEGAAILVRFESGLVGTFVIVDISPSAHNFESSTGENPTIPQAGKDFYRVFGVDGTLSVGDMVLTRHDPNEPKSWTSKLQEVQIPIGNETPFDEQILNLVRVVRGKEAPRCTGDDGLSAVVVCECIKQAMRKGGAVDVEYASRL